MIQDSPSPFTVPLTRLAHQEAQKFYHHHKQPEKAKQVYLNSLAIYAVNYYLKCLGFETTKNQNHIEKFLSNTANLDIDSLGKIECRYVLPNEENCYIPAESWHDRIGYVAVQFNQALTEAQLIGFLETSKILEINNIESVSLSQFQSIDTLIDKLTATELIITCLTNFLNMDNLADTVKQEWQDLKNLINPQLLQVAVRTSNQNQWIEKGQVLNIETLTDPVILGFALQPRQETELNISIELYPFSDKKYLPTEMKMQILDKTKTPVMEKNTKENSPYLRFYFRGNVGDRFTVKLTVDHQSFIKHFQV